MRSVIVCNILKIARLWICLLILVEYCLILFSDVSTHFAGICRGFQRESIVIRNEVDIILCVMVVLIKTVLKLVITS